MNYQEVFSWAEDVNGMMVYIDDVPGGASCNCFCPSCHEELIARHGNERAHGFAHASKVRGANLNICLKVILFKLAEYIVSTEKKICLPSYYGIFKSRVIEFETVDVNDIFEREDRQPDIIATTKDNEKYLIEFRFTDYVRHKNNIDYTGLNCLEIDLAGQKINDRNSLRNFLLSCDENRKWINNDLYFNLVEKLYKSKGKNVRLVLNEECEKCSIKFSCCAVKKKNIESTFILIDQNNKQYRLCKADEYDAMLKRNKELSKKKVLNSISCVKLFNNGDTTYKKEVEKKESYTVGFKPLPLFQQEYSDIKRSNGSDGISCFNCQRNLEWANKDGLANCGCYKSLGLGKSVDPDYAKKCRSFKKK